MFEYLKKLIGGLPSDIQGHAKTPAANYLFVVNQECEKLTEKDAQMFHHMIAKLLYSCKQTRQDIQTAVAFLCMCVMNPDNDDYKKLMQVMQYLCGTQDLTLTIELDEHPNWWVDSSYAMHPDMWSHSGIYMSLRKGAMYSGSCKKNFNTKSSTEAKLVAVDDAMGKFLWTRHFLVEQGHYVPTTSIYQDNKSTILVAENGRSSSSKQMQHLHVRYYFFSDQIKKGYVKVAFCPMQDMLVDFFTKTLQGALFVHMWEKVLNLPTCGTAHMHRSMLEDRATKHVNKER